MDSKISSQDYVDIIVCRMLREAIYDTNTINYYDGDPNKIAEDYLFRWFHGNDHMRPKTMKDWDGVKNLFNVEGGFVEAQSELSKRIRNRFSVLFNMKIRLRDINHSVEDIEEDIIDSLPIKLQGLFFRTERFKWSLFLDS